MTDREILELAAKAAGIPLQPDFAKRFDYYMADPLMWNPLKNDGDALRLAVKLFLWKAVRDGYQYVDSGNDFYAATRRSITRAAAEIGKAMP